MSFDTIISILVIIMIFILIYSRIRKQSLKDTADEIKEIFGGKKENG